MAKFETGDIVIFNNTHFGHVAMCFDPGGDSALTTFIHGTNSGNFKIDRQQQDNEGTITYMVSKNYWHFRPTNITPAEKIQIRKVASIIQQTAKYGIYRAIGLAFGNSSFGKGARKRLDKYKGRLPSHSIEINKGEKLISTITCSEAILVCYQLTFDEASPYFIKKDAAYTLPKTLAAYLEKTPAFEKIKSPI